MIRLTRLSGEEFILNAEMIRELESTPDTIITLATGQKLIVRESLEAIRDAVIEYKQTIMGKQGEHGRRID
jgi:flagellar protein FlbD